MTDEIRGESELSWRPVRVRLGDFDGWEGNPKRMSKHQAERLIKSTRRLGQVQTIAVSPPKPDGRRDIYDGHQRNSIWSQLFSPDLEVWALESSRHLTEKERRDVAMLTMQARGSFNWDIIANWNDVGDYFERLDITELRNDIVAIETLVRIEKNQVDIVDIDDSDEELDRLVEKWGVKTGDVWALGDHTLYCGDAREAGIECDFAIFDPPYNWKTDDQMKMMDWVRWKNALVMGTNNCLPLSSRADFCSWMVWDTETGYGLSKEV
jgi:hypothetical protein